MIAIKNRVKCIAVLFLVVVVAFAGVVSHAMIASSYVEKMLAEYGQSVNAGAVAVPLYQSPGLIYAPSFGLPGNGVYNLTTTVVDQKGEPRVLSPMVGALRIALTTDEYTWGVLVPYPFLIPLAVHLFVVGVIRFCSGLVYRKSKQYVTGRTFVTHALYSSVYAYFIAIAFQIERMLGASDIWGFSEYLYSFKFGWASLYTLLGFSIFMYLYCVLGTAGLQVRRKPTAKKQTCIRCGYRTEGLERCPECDLEVGAFIPSKLRINHWYLAAMFVVTFFSPVLVESVYSVFG